VRKPEEAVVRPSHLVLLLVVAFVAAPGGALEPDLKPGMDKEREAMIAKWKKTLAGGDQAAIEKTLAEAASRSGVAFGMSDWPQAVAEAARGAQPPVKELLLNHLRQHRPLINQATRDWIRELFKGDVLDPQGEQVRNWVKAGAQGPAGAEAALKAAASAKRTEELAGLLDAIARCGNDRFLPLVAPFLSHENEQVSQAALSVFKAQAKDMGPDLRSPKLCQVWWLQSGQGLFEGK
jgi:hypothetical protein